MGPAAWRALPPTLGLYVKRGANVAFSKRRRQEEELAPTSENITFLDEGENIFAEGVDEGHRIDPRAQKIFILGVVLLVVYVVALIIPKDILSEGMARTSSAGYTFSWFVADLQENIAGLLAVFTGNDSADNSYSVSMTHYIVIALAGAGLALSGAVYQGSFRNALVSPSTLGVMTGGSFGMLVWVVLFAGDEGLAFLVDGLSDVNSQLVDYWSSSLGLALTSFAGCLLVVGLVLLVLKVAGTARTSGIMLIITGQVIGAVIGAISNTVRYYFVTVDPYGPIADALTYLMVASFYRAFSWVDIVAIAVPLGITLFVVMRLRQKMMLLSFDEAEQRTLGVDARRMQITVVGLCTLLTAIVISFCGTVGFVGFLVPHLARRLVGPNFKYLLPASTVMGALFVLSAYVLVETTFGADASTMVGMYISIAGALVFLVTALRGKGAMLGGFR